MKKLFEIMKNIGIIFVFILVGCTQAIGGTTRDSACSLVPEVGFCRAAVPKYFFNTKINQCQQFTWGGCGGVVPFNTKLECVNSCSRESNQEYIEQLDKSRVIWEESKRTEGNSYQYTTNFMSWTGFGNETTITVEDGLVVKREHRSWGPDVNSSSQWQETLALGLGGHKEGAAIKTIDVLYEECRTLLLTKAAESHSVLLAFNNSGILQRCLFTPKNCADDCSTGIKIDQLTRAGFM